MTQIEIVAITVSAVIAAGIVWTMICNERTLDDRFKRAKEMTELDSDAEFWRTMDQFKQVSWRRHLWYRITLRNTDRLYDKH